MMLSFYVLQIAYLIVRIRDMIPLYTRYALIDRFDVTSKASDQQQAISSYVLRESKVICIFSTVVGACWYP